MRYQSTRNNVKGKSFQDVLMAGYANDGGFFMPEVIPVLTTDELKQFSSFNYAELCREIVKKFVASEEYQKLGLHGSFGLTNFSHHFWYSQKRPTITKDKILLFGFFLWPGRT